jgi:FimV-like protein
VKKKALVLAVGLAFATPTISVAKALPSDLVGLSLGEIQSKSYLNEPFKGVIPILFTNVEASKKLKVRLAPESVFKKIGAEKLSILNNLRFQVEVKNNKPVINIKSTRPIQMPFLNFVLEIVGPQGSIYQDYTTLLDPKGTTTNSFIAKVQAVKQQDNVVTVVTNAPASSTKVVLDANRTHTVKSGDTLSQIAQALNAADVSLKKMVTAIHQRNPNAFVNNNVNLLKAGAVLHIPTNIASRDSNFKTAAKTALKNQPSHFANAETSTNSTYTIKKGDNLSKLTKKLGHKEVSFTKMMKAIHTANPHAFSKNKINLLKIGKVLTIPSLEEVALHGLSSQKSQQAMVDPNLIVLDDPKATATENTKEFVLDGFVIEKGDTLAKITKQIGHKSIPYSQMMHAIYIANPDAFEKNNITTLVVGAIIRLPSVAEVKEMNSSKATPKSKRNSNKTTKEPTKQKLVEPVNVKEKSSSQQKSSSNNIAFNKLEKRVRELKRDLNKAHNNLSTLELSLAGKEVLLKQQRADLSKLASTLELLNGNPLKGASDKNDDESLKVISLDTSTADKAAVENLPSIDPSEIKDSTAVPQTDNIKSEILTATRSGYMPKEINQELTRKFKDTIAGYSQYMSGKELLASILALLFGLVLVRYRREIYAYTNISYDYPKYYPPFGEEEARALLKEKSINYHDTLVEMVDEPSDVHQENNSEFSNEILKECEELADELTDDLEIKTSVHSDNDDTNWDDLDKACDDYIAEYKEKNIVELTDVSDNIIEGAESQTEEMTFELFEALAEGVANKEQDPASSPVEDDTLIYDLDNDEITSHDTFEDEHLIPFEKLAKISEQTDEDRTQAS